MAADECHNHLLVSKLKFEDKHLGERQQELISVIVPIYNIKEYLSRCVESILAQTYRNLEIILVDDGSTDGTAELVDELAKRDGRIHVIHQENEGSSAARNHGIRESQGEYLSFIDSDDYIEPTMIEHQYEAIQTFQMPIAQVGRDEIAADGTRLPNICEPPVEAQMVDSETFMKELLLHRGDCSFCTKLTKRSLLEQEPFPEGRLNEDFHVLVKLLPHISGIASLPKQEYHVYYKPDSNTRKVNKNTFSRVYGDNVNNAEMVMEIVKTHFPELERTAMRFGLYQRLDYLLHVPITQMNAENAQYQQIVRYLKKHRKDIRDAEQLTEKQKLYLEMFSYAPKLIRQVHATIKRNK